MILDVVQLTYYIVITIFTSTFHSSPLNELLSLKLRAQASSFQASIACTIDMKYNIIGLAQDGTWIR